MDVQLMNEKKMIVTFGINNKTMVNNNNYYIHKINILPLYIYNYLHIFVIIIIIIILIM